MRAASGTEEESFGNKSVLKLALETPNNNSRWNLITGDSAVQGVSYWRWIC